ncbi:MAG: GNAT family N-acetyltransferase [Alteromonadaceae bacterium]|nr:GNAT family N-acetyltransferase [Alteromonadaceae bacterium]
MGIFSVEQVDWQEAKARLKKLRNRVFVCEWRIPRQAEFDEQDSQSKHVLVSNEQGEAIATGRITPDGEIGRIAVVSSYRSEEIYDTLYAALLEIAKNESLDDVFVQCNLDGVDHFADNGFETVGNVYMDSGIPRQRMRCSTEAFSLSKVELIH